MQSPPPFGIPRRRRYPVRPMANVGHGRERAEPRMPVDFHLSAGGTMVVVYDLGPSSESPR